MSVILEEKGKGDLAESEEEVQRDPLTRRAASEDFDIERVGGPVSGRGKERGERRDRRESKGGFRRSGLDDRV